MKDDEIYVYIYTDIYIWYIYIYISIYIFTYCRYKYIYLHAYLFLGWTNHWFLVEFLGGDLDRTMEGLHFSSTQMMDFWIMFFVLEKDPTYSPEI